VAVLLRVVVVAIMVGSWGRSSSWALVLVPRCHRCLPSSTWWVFVFHCPSFLCSPIPPLAPLVIVQLRGLVTWPLAPASHPASSGSQAWGRVLGCRSAGGGLVGGGDVVGVVVVTWWAVVVVMRRPWWWW
jgi:hypothetical protein